jgi:hypothetical protein
MSPTRARDAAAADADADDADALAACRVFLKLRALAVWDDLVGRECDITLVGDREPCANARFAGVDARERAFAMEALRGALGTHARARVRCEDVVSLSMRRRDRESADEDDTRTMTCDSDDERAR